MVGAEKLFAADDFSHDSLEVSMELYNATKFDEAYFETLTSIGTNTTK